MLKCHAELGPTHVAVGICPSSCSMKVICPDKHGFFEVSCCALCLPLDYAETVWADWMSCGAGVSVDGDGVLRCSLSLSPNGLPVSPMYSSGQLICGYLYLYMIPIFCSLISLSLGTISSVL